MKILRVEDRYFLVETERDYQNVALKVLNERRVLGLDNDDPKRKEFIEQITDAQDGDLALAFMGRVHDAEIISPEVV